jgi:hypothetical protein
MLPVSPGSAVGRTAPSPSGPWPRDFPFLGLAVLTQVLTRADTMLLAGFPGGSRAHRPLRRRKRPRLGRARGVPAVRARPLPDPLAARRHRTTHARDPMGLAMAAGILIGGAAAGALFTIREPLISIAFGAAFAPSIELLVRLVWLLPWAVSMALAGTVFAAWRRQRLALATLAAVVGRVGLSLNLRWIPAHGVHGAAAAAVWAHAVRRGAPPRPRRRRRRRTRFARSAHDRTRLPSSASSSIHYGLSRPHPPLPRQPPGGPVHHGSSETSWSSTTSTTSNHDRLPAGCSPRPATRTIPASAAAPTPV